MRQTFTVQAKAIARADASLCAVLDRHAEELLAKFPPRDSVIDQAQPHRKRIACFCAFLRLN
jgi:hypothetical protein